MNRLLILSFVFTLLTSGAFSQPPGSAASVQRSIIDLGEGLYKVETGQGVSPVFMFLATDEGILIVDPPNPESAQWLNQQLETLYPGLPVKYVIETHYHWDHTRGASAYVDTATFIGHENLPENMLAAIADAPPPGNTRDSNGDNLLSREEAQTGTLANFDAMDLDGDNFLTQQELTANTVIPDIVFSDELTLNFGGKTVSLIWSKNRHTNDLIDVFFPDHGVLYATDYVWINRMCCNFGFDDRPVTVWIDSLRALEELQFTTLINSHFEAGSKDDLIAFRRWLEDLYQEVATGVANGQTLAEIQANAALTRYENWVNYDTQLAAMMASAYASLVRE